MRRPPARVRAVLLVVTAISGEAFAGAWTLGAGRLRVKEGVSYWQTDRKFASTLDEQLVFPGRGPVSAGDRIPFDPVTGGRLQVLALTTEAHVGIVDRLEAGVSMPLVWADFDTSPVDSVDSRFGPGDVVLSAQALVFRGDRLAVAARTEGKLPTGRFDPSIYSAPVAEGQADVAFVGSAGLSLYPHGYANAEAGWRFRLENPDNGRDPGDEILLALEGGLDLPHGFLLKLALDGLLGRPGVQSQFGVETELPRRRLFSIWGGVLLEATRSLTLELAVRALLAGEDFPTGVPLFASASYEIGAFDH